MNKKTLIIAFDISTKKTGIAMVWNGSKIKQCLEIDTYKFKYVDIWAKLENFDLNKVDELHLVTMYNPYLRHMNFKTNNIITKHTGLLVGRFYQYVIDRTFHSPVISMFEYREDQAFNYLLNDFMAEKKKRTRKEKKEITIRWVHKLWNGILKTNQTLKITDNMADAFMLLKFHMHHLENLKDNEKK